MWARRKWVLGFANAALVWCVFGQVLAREITCRMAERKCLVRLLDSGILSGF